jgi:hypothetical protein
LVQAFLKKWWVESDFKEPNLPLSLRFTEDTEHNVYIGYGGQLKNDSFSFYLSIAVLLAGLTKPGEVGEILALFRLKSLSLDYKAKLKSPCFCIF